MKYRIAREARAELFDAALYYESCRTGLGVEFQTAFEKAVARILNDPTSFAISTGNARTVFLKKFPYQIVFQVQLESVEIYAVAHNK